MNFIDLIIVCISLALEVIATTLSAGSRTTEIGSLLIVFRLWRVVRVMHAVGDVQHQVKHDEMATLQKKLVRLQIIQDAHHTVIKELHREYTERVRCASCRHCSAIVVAALQDRPRVGSAVVKSPQFATALCRTGQW